MTRYQMEPGFGWHYPPGTTGSSDEDEATCADCGQVHPVRVISELGTSWIEPEETPCCGADWKDE